MGLYFGSEFSEDFEKECLDVINDYEKFDVLLHDYMNYMLTYNDFQCLTKRNIFVKSISYGVPSPRSIDLVVEAFKKHCLIFPNAKLIDLGSGSGVFTWLFHRNGIEKNKLVALDRKDNKTHKFKLKFWKITEDDNYIIHKNDAVFCSWGSIRGNIIDNYIDKGGNCMIIQTENGYVAYPPADFFIDENGNVKSGWKVESHKIFPSIPGGYEYISINTRY